jgi:hypothetical protein
MIIRIKFNKGQQRKFIQDVISKINCPSLRELINRGIEVNYSTLKNYFNESRLIPENIFNQLIEISELNKKEFNFEILEENWGQIKGGKKSRR